MVIGYRKIKTQKVVFASMGEIALKGLNRKKFEDRLIGNIKRRFEPERNFEVAKRHSKIIITPKSEQTVIEEALEKVVNVFGIVSAGIALKTHKKIENIHGAVFQYVEELLENERVKTFKIEAKRSDKDFPLDSPQICSEFGAFVLEKFPELSVDLDSPDIVLSIEVREFVYVHGKKVKGVRGLPVGTGGKGLLLLSGGIDSPVAGYMMAGRGMEIEGVYFHSPPYTDERAKEKVLDLAEKLKKYVGRIKVHIVEFTQLQLELKEKCPPEMLTIHIRRLMMKISQKIADNSEIKAIITGESLGQVASQTIEAIACTDEISNLPVLRPLIGLDKETIVNIAKEIGTYETSILPYEDCCTLFVAKHPKTKPTIDYTEYCEKNVDLEELAQKGLNSIKVYEV